MEVKVKSMMKTVVGNKEVESPGVSVRQLSKKARS